MASLATVALSFVSRNRWILSALQPIEPWINTLIINRACTACPARPNPYSAWTPNRWTPTDRPQLDEAYVTWPGLVDRRYSGRHLPPAAPRTELPPVEKVVELLLRHGEGELHMKPSHRTSVLFCFFAQWFTDSFLRTHPMDARLNTSNHEIDLCEIYGLNAETAAALRTGQDGLMRVEEHATGQYPPRLFGADGHVRPEFRRVGGPSDLSTELHPSMAGGYHASLPDFVHRAMPDLPEAERNARVAKLYATGLERGSNTILYAAFNALFLREHNRIARRLKEKHPSWDDNRLFETARNVNIVQALKLVIEEYINHLAGLPLQFKLDRNFAEKQGWYRTNRIAIEFDLLYRWHALIPETIAVEDRVLGPNDYRWNNGLLEEIGIERLFAAASIQPAGRMQLHNTPRFMSQAEAGGLNFARWHRVQPFNAYRRHFKLDPYRTHEELTGDKGLAAELKALYPDVDDVEFQVGLFAENHAPDASFGELLGAMVALDAFTQVFTNPLLAKEVHDLALGPEGSRIAEETICLQDIVARNAASGAPVLAKFKLPKAA